MAPARPCWPALRKPSCRAVHPVACGGGGHVELAGELDDGCAAVPVVEQVEVEAGDVAVVAVRVLATVLGRGRAGALDRIA